MDRNDGIEHLFTWDRDIEGWPSKVMVSMTLYENEEYVVFVKLITPGFDDRDYVMRWVSEGFRTGFPEWEFQVVPGSTGLPQDLMDLEEAISREILWKDL